MSALIKAFTEAVKPSAATPRTTEPPTYDGARDAMVIDSWIRSVNRYARFHDWVEERKLSYAVTLLRGRAEAWYRSLEIGEEEPENWETFEEGLVGFFKPENYERIARDKLASYRQTTSVTNYVNGFMDVISAVPSANQAERCDRFIRGLSNKFCRAHVRQNDNGTLKMAIHSALSFEASHNEGMPYFQRMNSNTQTNRSSSHSQQKYDPMDLDAMDSRSKTNQSRPNNRSCFYCGKPGHLRNNCRKRKEDFRRLDNDNMKKHGDSSHFNSQDFQ